MTEITEKSVSRATRGRIPCFIEDWTPLFEDPRPDEAGPFSVDAEALSRFWAARALMLEAHTALLASMVDERNGD